MSSRYHKLFSQGSDHLDSRNFTIFLNKNRSNFTLDWLRGQKLTFESIYEMRK